MADEEKKKRKLFQRKNKETEEPEVAVQEPVEPQKPEEYRSDPTLGPKDYFEYYRDKVLSDDRFINLDNDGRKAVLNKFFDTYGKDYLDKMGMSDKFDSFKQKWVDDTYKSHMMTQGEPEKKSEPEKPVSNFSKGYEFQYEEGPTFPADNLRVDYQKVDIDAINAVNKRRQEVIEQFPKLAQQLYDSEDFGYAKENPAYFMERLDRDEKKLDKYLKKNTDLVSTEREAFINYMVQSSQDLMADKLRDDYAQKYPDADLSKAVEKYAQPFIENKEPGTFLDPDTGERMDTPKTDEAADHLALLDKYSKELVESLISLDVSNPLSQEKQSLEEEYSALETEGEGLAQIVKDAEEWSKSPEAAGLNQGEYLLEYTKWMEKYDSAYADYMKKVDAFNLKSDEYNKKIQDIPKEVPNNKTIKERLYGKVEDAALELDYWEGRYDDLTKAYRGELPSFQKPSVETIERANQMRRHAKAKFEAAARMYYNNEGPTSIDKDWGYMGEIFGDNLLKGIGKAGEAESYFDKATQQEVMMAMGQIGHEIGVEFTPDEKEALEVRTLEGVVAGGGTMLPSMVELILLNQGSGLIKSATGLNKLKNGYQTIKNAELGITRIIGMKDPIPTGWKVVKTFKPTNFQKAYATVASLAIDEAMYAGVGDFQLGAITGMNTAHLILPDVKFRGWLQFLNPILDIIYKAGIGATTGMEAGAAASKLLEAATSDKSVGQVFNELYPNADETSKRLLQNYIINSLMFGGMGLVTTGMAKQNTAPMGAKFNRFGQANWYAYFSPVMRDKVYKAAKDFEAKGYPDAAQELYTWLDLTKDPVEAKQMKQARMENIEKAYSILPIGYLRELRELHGNAIRVLETQARQPDFKGTLTIPIKHYADLKEGEVINVDGTYYEVTGFKNKKYQAVDIMTGDVREIDPVMFDRTIEYTLNHPLEVPQRLEAHYEMAAVLDKIISRRGRYGENFELPKGPEPPTALPKGSGEVYVEPPAPRKIQKKREEIAKREEAMREETGLEPIEMPEYMQKQYSYGNPEEVAGLSIKSFSENLAGRNDEVAATQKEYKERIAKLEEEKYTVSPKERRVKQNEIDRLTIAGQRLENEFQNEVSEWVSTAKPFLETQIRDQMPDATDEDVNAIMGDLWQIMTQPGKADMDKDIGTVLNELINAKATEGQGVVQPVQPTETPAPEEGQAPEEELPKGEMTPEERLDWFTKRVEDKGGKIVGTRETTAGTVIDYTLSGDKSPRQATIFKDGTMITGTAGEEPKKVKFSWDNLDAQPTDVLKKKLEDVEENIIRETGADRERAKAQKRAIESVLSEREGERPKKVTDEEIGKFEYGAVELPGYKLMLVDGNLVRKNLDPDFTDSATWQDKDYIPQTEIWVDVNKYNGKALLVKFGELADKTKAPAPEQPKPPTAEEQRKRRISTLLQRIDSYNKIPKGHNQKRAKLYMPISRAATDLGFVLKLDKGVLSVVDQNGKKVRWPTRRTPKEEIESHWALSEYEDPEFIQFVKNMAVMFDEFLGYEGGIQPSQMEKAFADIISNKKTVNTNKLLDSLQDSWDLGYLSIKPSVGSPQGKIDLDEYKTWLGNEVLERFSDQYGDISPDNVDKAVEWGLMTEEQKDKFLKNLEDEEARRAEAEREITGPGEERPPIGEVKGPATEEVVKKPQPLNTFKKGDTVDLTNYDEATFEISKVTNSSVWGIMHTVGGHQKVKLPGSEKAIMRLSAEEAEAARKKYFGEGPITPETIKKALEKTEKPKIDVSKELKEMQDLLGDIDLGQGAAMGAGGTGELDPRDKMIKVAQILVDKFIKQDIIPFTEIIKEILPIVKPNNLQQLLPFLKQGYLAYSATAPDEIVDKMDDRKTVREFDTESLDALIGEMHKPEDKFNYTDVLDKIFYIPELNNYVEIVRVEEWKNPNDAMIQSMGGLFGEMPDQYEKIEVGILRNPLNIGFDEKKAVLLDRFRALMKLGNAIEVEPYDNKEYVRELEQVIDTYREIGDNVRADALLNKMHLEPLKPVYSKPDWTWKDYIAGLKAAAATAKFQNDILSGKIKYSPIKPPDQPTIESMLDAVESMVKRGDPLTPYIKMYMSDNLLEEVRQLLEDHHKILAQLGFTSEAMYEFYYLRNNFLPTAPVGSLYAVGSHARAFEQGKPNSSMKKITDSVTNVIKEIEETKSKHALVREKAFIWDVKNRIWKGHMIGDFRELTKIASDWGITSKPIIREAAEVALVEVSKVMAKDGRMKSGEKFSRLMSVYNEFPTLSYRTGEIKEKQQFSTPPPLSYLMGAYTNAADVGRVLDPSAGNGSLLITAQKGAVRANDIDEKRYWHLIGQGYRTFKEDSTHGLVHILDGPVDALHINPPFGGPEEKYNGYPLHGEYVPVAYALESLKDEGKAAIIVGGHVNFKNLKGEVGEFGEPLRMPNEQMTGKDLYFFNWLYKYYNVEDVINIPGEFYKTMGSSYPVKLILVNGRKAAPEGAAPLYSDAFKPVESWNDLESRIISLITKPNEKSVLQPKVDAERGDDTLVGRGEKPEIPDTQPERPDAIISGETGEIGPADPTGESGQPPTQPSGPDPGEGRRGDRGSDNEPPVIPKPDGGVRPENTGQRPTFGELRPKRDPGDLPTNNIGKPNERTKRELGLTERTGEEVTPYIPLSGAGSGNFIVPATIAVEVEDALMQLKHQIGDIDAYVMGKLKYNSKEEMADAFFAEQVDGIGQAIFNIEANNAMIIGHQTGTGKGRIAAGVIRYAVENGKLPVFITKKAELFTDIYRDLVDIGSPSYKPFIMNKKFSTSGQKVKVFHPETGEAVAEVDEDNLNKVIGTQNNPGSFILPEGYDILVMTTYSQFTTDERDDAKREFLRQLANDHDVVFIMDESHEAAGGMSSSGMFFQGWMSSTNGGIFLSATYAKRPDNMPLYAIKTVMSETNMDQEEMVEAVKTGGPALQEIVTMQLAESGQFSKIGFKMDAEMNYLMIGDNDPTQRTYNPELGMEMVAKFDQVTSILREIINFQADFVNPVLSGMNDDIKREGRRVEGRRGTSQAGISNTPYFSRVWHIIDNLLLSSKIQHMLPFIIQDCDRGLKPVVSLKTTMESMFTQMHNAGDLEKGDIIPLDFSYVLEKGMVTVMKYTEKDEQGNGERKVLSPEELTESGREEYYRLIKKIRAATIGIPISPIDVLRRGIIDAGYKPLELTGRGTMFDMNEQMTEGTYLTNDKPDMIKAIQLFNNNPGYVIIATKTGSTGLSYHSSARFKDQSQRTGYYPDPELDINVVIQHFGRIYRADQVNKPIYNIVSSMLPAETRRLMMLARKLKSLDANTSGNQKQSKNLIDSPDFLNKYGDEVVYDYLKDNPDINNMIGDPLKIRGGDDDNAINKQNAAHNVTGKIQVLPSEMQEAFYKEIQERYDNKIEYLNATGTNDLMVTSEPLEAVFISSEVAIDGQGGFSSFGDDTVLNTAEVKVLKRPFTKEQLEAELAKIPADHVDQVRNAMAKGIQEKLTAQIEKTQRDYEEKRKIKKQQILDKPRLSAEDKQNEYDIEIDKLNEHERFRIKTLEDVANETMRDLHQLLNYFRPGMVLEIPFTEDEQADLVRINKGVFLSFDVNMKKDNPWVKSNFMLRFATADSRRMFRIPASKPNHIYAIVGHSNRITTRESEDTRTNWDSLKKHRQTETRYIVTGNILQGMNLFKHGRLIQFTKKDGTVEKGILMPENWIKPDNNVVRMPISRVANIIKALAPGEFVESFNGDVLIKKRPYSDPQTYEIRFPASTQRGEKYYSNDQIKDLVADGFFEVRGDRMVGILPEYNLQQMLDLLSNTFKTMMLVENSKLQKGFDQTDSNGMMQQFGAGVSRPIERGGLSNPYNEVDYEEAAGAKVGERIPVDPITGAKPKKIWQIQLDLTKAVGNKLRYVKSPVPGRRKVIGAYYAGSGRTVIKWEEDLDTTAHEMGHDLDDLFGLLGPAAQSVYPLIKAEWTYRNKTTGKEEHLWDYGSKPPKGHPDAEKYKMSEGMAEFMRALVMNPAETRRRFSVTYNWVKGRITETDPDIWDAIMQFSKDIREWWGAKASDQIASKMHLDPNEMNSPWVFTRENQYGQFRLTFWDNASRKIFNMLNPLEVSYRWAMRQKGIDIDDPNQLSPSQNFEVVVRLHLGLNIKMINMMEHGFVTFQGERIIDRKTGKPLSFNLMMAQLPSHSYKDMEANRQEALNFGMAERIKEIPWKFEARQIRYDLNAMTDKLPPLHILSKHPTIVENYINKIQKILDKIESGDLDEDDVWLDPDRYDFRDMVIAGIAQQDEWDYNKAVAAVKELEDMKTTDPDKHRWITEFNRIYRAIGSSLIDYLADAGMISEEGRRLIHDENLHYMAMRRLFALDPQDLVSGKEPTSIDVTSTSRGSKDLEPKIVIYPVKGSHRALADPVTALIESWMRGVESAELNYVVQAYAMAFSPRFETRQMYDETSVPKTGEIAWVSKTPEPNSITFFRNGKRVYLVSRNRDIYNAFVNILPESRGSGSAAMRLLAFAPQLLRRSIVVAPPFMVRNILRDLQSLLIVGQSKRYLRLQDLKVDKEMRQKFELMGAGQFGHLVMSKRGYYRVMKKAMFQASNDRRKYLYNPSAAAKNLGDNLFGWMSESERVVRMIQYKAAYREGKQKYKLSDYEAHTRAAFIARDLLDFMVGGTWSKELNKVFIFTNAAFRALDKIYRAFKNSPGSTTLAMLIMSIIPSLLNSILIAMFADDESKEEYLNQPDYLRDMFYRIPLGRGWLTIPKPYELGVLGSIFQRGADAILLGDEGAFDNAFLNSIIHLITPYDIAGLFGGYSGFIQAGFNKDLFRQKNIIPPDEMGISVISRNTEYASKFGRMLQKASDFGLKREEGNYRVDARLVDAFIMGQLGYYGSYFLKATEYLLPGEKQRKFEIDLTDTGLWRTDPVYSAPDVQYLMGEFKLHPWLKDTKLYDTFQGLLHVYFRDDVQKNNIYMEQVDHVIRQYATAVRKELEPINLYKVDEAKKLLKQLNYYE